jgi:hypothetical protein
MLLDTVELNSPPSSQSIMSINDYFDVTTK